MTLKIHLLPQFSTSTKEQPVRSGQHKPQTTSTISNKTLGCEEMERLTPKLSAPNSSTIDLTVCTVTGLPQESESTWTHLRLTKQIKYGIIRASVVKLKVHCTRPLQYIIGGGWGGKPMSGHYVCPADFD